MARFRSLFLAAFIVAAPAVPVLAQTTEFELVEIAADDGVTLHANLIAPTAPGPHPGLVFISSWGLNDAEYLAQASAFAHDGYVVLSYTPRGFWQSEGSIDVGGPLDIADVSAAIDWLVAHTAVDPARIGAGGVSYGAGIALIASAFDSRIRAVAALSGWTDLAGSLYGGETREAQTMYLLVGAALLFGTPSPEMQEMVGDYFANRDIDQVIAYGQVRSAASYLDAIEASGPAILLANATQDTIFGPNQLVDFFGGLSGPTRLELAPGDHAVVEATGLFGLPNHVWTSVHRWFDRYLLGADTGIDEEPPVVLRPRPSGGAEFYANWADVTGSTVRLGLGAVRALDGTGPLGGAPASGWARTILSGIDTLADGGVILLSAGLEALSGIAPTVWLPAVSRLNAGVWVTGPRPATSVRGIPRLRLRVTPTGPNGTVVAYLYEVDFIGTARLIAHAPRSWVGANVGAPLDLDVAFPATAYDVPAGRSLAVVVDTEDPLYLDVNPPFAPLTFSGPSWLDLPLR